MIIEVANKAIRIEAIAKIELIANENKVVLYNYLDNPLETLETIDAVGAANLYDDLVNFITGNNPNSVFTV